MQDRVVNILGTEYHIYYKTLSEDRMLLDRDGYCDYTSKKIVVSDENTDFENFSEKQKEILRHEIIHAFMFESGLGYNWEHKPTGHEETTVDWMAIQFPKILQAFRDAGAIQREQSNSQGIQDAAKLIRHEFKTNPESHKALVSSIESVLKELPENGETWTFEIAEMIAKRIIGD